MKTTTNIFGERICNKDCVCYMSDEGYEEYCNARLEYTGRIKQVGHKIQYGQLCKLPLDFKIVMNET